MANYIYPKTVTIIGALATLLDTANEALKQDDAGFSIGGIPLINDATGTTTAMIVWDNDYHAVVEFL